MEGEAIGVIIGILVVIAVISIVISLVGNILFLIGSIALGIICGFCGGIGLVKLFADDHDVNKVLHTSIKSGDDFAKRLVSWFRQNILVAFLGMILGGILQWINSWEIFAHSARFSNDEFTLTAVIASSAVTGVLYFSVYLPYLWTAIQKLFDFIVSVVTFLISLLFGENMQTTSDNPRLLRNKIYPIRNFQLAYATQELRQYVPDLADECAKIIFSKNQKPDASLQLSPIEIENICVEHSKKMIPKLSYVKLCEKRKFRGQTPQAFLYLAKQYAANNAGAKSKRFWQNLLQKHKKQAYDLLISQAEGSLSSIYSEAFFAEISSIEQLKQYPKALGYTVQAYVNGSLRAKRQKVIHKLLCSDPDRLELYEKIVARSQAKDNPAKLINLYDDSFFQRIPPDKIYDYPKALECLAQSYIQQKTGLHATRAIEALLSKNDHAVIALLFRFIHAKDNKDLAMQMISEYPHLANSTKVKILRLREGNSYIDRALEKLGEQLSTGDSRWSGLFQSIGEKMNREETIPTNTKEARNLQMRLQRMKEKAETVKYNMLEVEEIEELLSALKEFMADLKANKK